MSIVLWVPGGGNPRDSRLDQYLPAPELSHTVELYAMVFRDFWTLLKRVSLIWNMMLAFEHDAGLCGGIRTDTRS